MRAYNRRAVAKGATGPPTMHLPSAVFELFTPRPPLEFVAPDPPRQMGTLPQEGLAALLSRMDDKVSLVGKAPPGPTGIPVEYKEKARRRAEKRERERAKREERSKKRKAELEERSAVYDPNASKEGKTANAYNTMFVGNLPKSTSKGKLRQVMEQFGPVKDVVLYDRAGFAFVEFEAGEDLRAACTRQNASKIAALGKRVVVDVERARTVKNWKPRALGGGVARKAAQELSSKKRSWHDDRGGGGGGDGGRRDRDWDREGRGGEGPSPSMRRNDSHSSYSSSRDYGDSAYKRRRERY